MAQLIRGREVSFRDSWRDPMLTPRSRTVTTMAPQANMNLFEKKPDP